MIPIKIQCSCGQKYAFDVEPINGRMPQVVNCPVCGADGTAAANEIIARQLSAQTAPVTAQNQHSGVPRPPFGQTKPKNSKITLYVTLTVVVGFAAFGAAGWFVWHKQHAEVVPDSVSKPASRQINTNAASSYATEMKDRVTLPPEISSFIGGKEQQAGEIASKLGLALSAELKNFFAAAKSGRLREAGQIYWSLRQSTDAGHPSAEFKTSISPVAMDVELAVDAFGEGDPELVLALARGMTNSLPPGCIYFGGTDSGRGLPTALCRSPGDPFFVITQNGLADGRYLEYLRDMYGTRIQLPTTNEVSECFSNYTADAQQRMQAGKLQPGEDVRMENGKPVVWGQVAVMKINGLVAKSIFDKNPGREFYVEESFPLDWMYPYLLPHGLLMKLNRMPLDTIPSEEIQKDEIFWSKELVDKIGDWLTKDAPVSNVCAFAEKVFANKDLSDFKGNPKFVGDKYNSGAYSHLRDSIAGIYAWRLGMLSGCPTPPQYLPKNESERQQLVEAADFAFKQAFALCPHNPEATYRYINFLVQLNRFDDAILVVQTAKHCDPANEQLKNLAKQLETYKKK